MSESLYSDKYLKLILKYNTNMPITHIFMMCKFKAEDVKFYKCNKELAKECKKWIEYYRTKVDKESYPNLYNDFINTHVEYSRNLTESIKIKSDAGKDLIYRSEYHKRKWGIYKK